MKKTLQYRNENVLSYAEYGDKNGAPILVQHGLIASIKDFSLFHLLLGAGLRVISIARPGYGDSSPYEMRNIAEWGEIVSVLVDQLALPFFDVFGISSGAPYSYSIAHQLPQRVRNLFILSGTPALYAVNVLALWPYPINKNATIAEMQDLAYELFFAGLSEEDQEKDDIKNSLRNRCFGVAQDLKLRGVDWGFQLPELETRVYMRHSQADEAVPLVTAEMTARLLPNCHFEKRENDTHFSQEVLDDFIRTVLLPINHKT